MESITHTGSGCEISEKLGRRARSGLCFSHCPTQRAKCSQCATSQHHVNKCPHIVGARPHASTSNCIRFENAIEEARLTGETEVTIRSWPCIVTHIEQAAAGAPGAKCAPAFDGDGVSRRCLCRPAVSEATARSRLACMELSTSHIFQVRVVCC
eukprot:scaffold40081_cov32-Tisochrysis_lutea.AAC.6